MSLLFPLGLRGQDDPAGDWKRFEVEKPFMGVRFGFVVYAQSVDQAQQGIVAAFERIRELEECLSDYDPDSELSRLCRQAKPGEAVKVSEDLMEVLQLSDRVHAASDGSFDPTIGPLSRRWRKARKENQVPKPEEIEKLKQGTGWRHVQLDIENSAVTLDRAGMMLDFGGIAKGFAADEAIRVLRENGMPSALVDAGGDVTVGDAPPGKKGWKIAVSQATGERLELSNASVATSGDRFQYLEHDGQRFSHILNPKTGWGMTDSRLVTVVTRRPVVDGEPSPPPHRIGALADAWASALSVMPEKLLKDSVKDKNGVAGVQVIRVGKEPAEKLIETGVFEK